MYLMEYMNAQIGMKHLTIDRSIWLRGEGNLRSFLLRPDDGKMCCVGIYCHAVLGIPKEKLKGVHWPHSSRNLLPPEGAWLNDPERVTDVNCALAADNDCVYIEDDEREHRIATIFAKNGVEVEFVG